MVGARAPPVSDWDDEDYGQKLRVFCGKRRLPSQYIHISKANIERMFSPNPDPEVPVHGIMATRYRDYVDEHTAFGPDANDRYHATDPSFFEEDADFDTRGKTMSQIKKEAFKKCLVVTAEDDAFLHAVSKNGLAHRLRLTEIGFAEYLVKDALGIDVAHPHYERCKYSAVKNRDTWQNRTLDSAFEIASRIYTSEYGQEKIAAKFKGFGYFTHDEVGNRKRWLVPVELLKDKVFSLDIAKKIFYVCMDAIDDKELCKSNGKPTAYGKALMYKAMAIIQFEMVYLIARWTNKVTGKFIKLPDNQHARDLADYFPYLGEMDEKYLHKKTIEAIDSRGNTSQIIVARLYPMDRNRTYGKTRRRRKHFEMNVACENQFTMGDLDDNSDEE